MTPINLLQPETPPTPQTPTFCCSNNLCLCGDSPPWLNNAGNGTYINGTSVNGTSVNGTSGNGTMTGNGTMPPPVMFSRNGTSLGTPCVMWPPQCEPQHPADWYVDNPPLLALRDILLAANNNSQAQYALGYWSQYRVPCTNNDTTGTCEPCGWQDTCGAVRQSDMKLLCNYRFITCRDRRVTGLYLGRQVGATG